jgi:hypothetical protein
MGWLVEGRGGDGGFTVNRPRLMVPTNLEMEIVERSILLAFSFFSH